MGVTHIALPVAVVLFAGACTGNTADPSAVTSAGRSQATDGSGPEGGVELSPARRKPPSSWSIGPERDRSFLVLVGATRPGPLRRVLGALDRSGAPAAFFLPGRFLRSHRNTSRAILEAGHHLGHMGWDGARLGKSGRRALKRSLRKAQRAVARVGADPRPFLVTSGREPAPRVMKIAGRLGYRLVRPTFEINGRRHKRIVRGVKERGRAGSIVQLRLDRRSHRRALTPVVRALRSLELDPAPIRRLTRAASIRWDVTLAPGMEGPRVRRLQQDLNDATFLAGDPDGVFGPATSQAVLAFEKFHGLDLDGIVEPAEMERIVAADVPEPPDRGSGDFIDIDLTRQILVEVHDGKVVATLPVSSANGEYYRSRSGGLAVAHTPRGDFEIERKIPGWRTSYLGSLYQPLYFYGGYAIHGSPSVPAYPASHGCIRIPMHVATDFYERNSLGVPVFVHD